jgi:hypothetical protein
LRDFLAAQPPAVELIPLNDPGLELDIDTPEDFEKAKRLWPTA